MAGLNWYVDINRSAINWGTAVVAGKATLDIYEIQPEFNSPNGTSLQVWRFNGQAVLASEVTTAQADQSAAGIPPNRPDSSGNIGGALTVAAGANNGTAPPVPSVSGTDRGGVVSFGSGGLPAIGRQVAVSFSSARGSAPRAITVSGYNAATAGLQVYVDSATITTNGFSIATNIAPTASQAVGTYSVAYSIVA